MVAAAMGRLSVCHELIERGVNVNHIDSSSLHNTALTLAAEAGHADVVSYNEAQSPRDWFFVFSNMYDSDL